MKRINLVAVAIALIVTACSTSNQVYDDVYYSRKDKQSTGKTSDQMVVSGQTQTTAAVTGSSEYDYQASYQEGVATKIEIQDVKPSYSTTETVTETDGTVYTTTETYYDSEYEQSFKRFDDDYSGFGYYDSYYTGCMSPSLSLGFGYPYGYGMSFNYGWGNYYGYSPYGMYYPYYDPWYSYYPGSYWSGYNNGYYDGYYDGYYGNSYYAGGGGYYYGPRANYSGSTTSARGSNKIMSDNKSSNQVIATGRGVRPGATSNGSTIDNSSNVSKRGTSNAIPEAVNGATTINRTQRPAATETRQDPAIKNSRPATQTKEARPTSNKKINEYRNKYNRPASTGNSSSGTQRLDRPKTYTSPSVRQPKSSSEYVRPQNEPNNSTTPRPAATENKNRSTTVKSQPARTTSTETRTSPSRSSSTESYSSPSRSSNSNNSSRSTSSPSSTSSSSSSSSSSGSSRGRR